ncbi:hypothetical protein VAA96_004545 [Salmonella enterica]|nr:hypothetical protein [Salmonella enterica]
MMLLPYEEIRDEMEFKHACKSYGIEFIKICRWIQQQKKDAVFKTKNTAEQQNLIWFTHNIESLINEVANENEKLTPDFDTEQKDTK